MRRTSIAITAILLILLAGALAQGAYIIEPKTKGWAVHDPVDDHYFLTVKHEGQTDNPVVLRIEPIARDPNQDYFFDQLPPELRDYMTITPNELTLKAGMEAQFKISIAFPDMPEIYNKTYEVHLLVVDSNPYNDQYGKQEQLHTVRMFMPDGRPPPPPQPTPIYVYAAAVIVFFLFMAAVVIILKRKTMTIAAQDAPSIKANEWGSLASEGRTAPPDFSDLKEDVCDDDNEEYEADEEIDEDDAEPDIVDDVEKARLDTPVRTTYKRQKKITPVRLDK